MSEHRKKTRVFVVDDEEVISSTIAAILRLEGFEATAFTQSLEALSASRSKRPEVLISDIVMPRLSGIDLAIAVKQFCPGCKVLLFSGQWSSVEFPQLARGNGHEFETISKPVHPRELINHVKKMVLELSSTGTDGEDHVRKQVAENMRRTVDAVKAEIAASAARKRSVKRRAGHDVVN